MEQLCNDVINNICLNHENEVVKDITDGLELLVNRFVKNMTMRFPDFKVKCVTPCGSMAEKTRIIGLNGLEYDYIVEMESWPKCGKLYFKPSCEGSMQPLYMVQNENSVCLKTGVLTAFLYNLCKSIEKSCEESFCPNFSFQGRNKFDPYKKEMLHHGDDRCNISVGCQQCSVFMTTCSLEFHTFEKKLIFIWLPKGLETYKNVVSMSRVPPFHVVHPQYNEYRIYVDIHPVLIVHPEHVLQCLSEKNRSSESDVYCYLFPNNKTNHIACCDGGRACWRISHYNTELQMLQQTSQLHRNMFMILKFITEALFKNENEKHNLGDLYRLNSYEVKTAVLHHIKNCNMPESDIEKCLKNTIRLLSQCFNESKLTQIVSGVNILHLNTSFSSRDPRDHSSYQIIGLVFEAFYELLTTGIDTRTEELLIDFKMIKGEVVRALWKSVYPNKGYNKYNKMQQEKHRATSVQIQACQEALKKYVDERTRKSATSMLQKYKMMMSRYNRFVSNSKSGTTL